MKWKRWVSAAALSLTLGAGLVQPVLAETQGEITVKLYGSDDLPILKSDFRLVKVGSVQNGTVSLDVPFQESRIDLNSLKDNDAGREKLLAHAKTLEKIWKKNEKEIEAVKPAYTADDAIHFTGLSEGVWLLSAGNPGEYRPYQPTILVMPARTDIGAPDEYQINMTPKRELPLLVIDKTDEAGKNILNKNFSFNACDAADCSGEKKTLVADTEHGTVTYLFSHYETVWLKESKAPSGYTLSSETVKVTFSEDGVFVNDREVGPDDGVSSFHVQYVNEKEPSDRISTSSSDKPKDRISVSTSTRTGQTFFAGLCGLSLIGFFVLIKRRNEEKE